MEHNLHKIRCSLTSALKISDVSISITLNQAYFREELNLFKIALLLCAGNVMIFFSISTAMLTIIRYGLGHLSIMIYSIE